MFDNPIYVIDTSKKTRVIPSTWPLDKYPDAPTLDAHSTVTILDVCGAGVVTMLHSSVYIVNYGIGENAIADSKACYEKVLIKIFYDNHDKPDIEMPLGDFLGDISGDSDYFTTKYFSKVKRSHNFRLPIPFREHIKIQLENPTSENLYGYSDVQYDLLPSLPDNVGYLYVDYKAESVQIPQMVATLCKVDGSGTIAAHWFSIESDNAKCAQGEILCEANVEFYVDGADTPSLNYLGVEDLYGFSWGFEDLQSDYYCAIIKKEKIASGAKISMIRCRDNDAIHFEKSIEVRMDYTQEYFSELSVNPLHTEVELFRERGKTSFIAPYKSCYYYYCL